MASLPQRLIFCVLLVGTFVAVLPATLPDQFNNYPEEFIAKTVRLSTNEIFPTGTFRGKEAEVDNIIKHGGPFVLHLFDVFNIKKFYSRVGVGVPPSVMCSACKLGITLLNGIVKLGATENEIGSLADYVCTLFKIETPPVCKGLSNLFKREIFTVMYKVGFSPSEMCGVALGKSCSSAVSPLQNWTIPLTPIPKPPVRPILPPEPGAPVVTVLHLSDTHLDPYYKEGSLAACNEPLCCRATSGVATKASDAAGYWGDYRHCDIPLRTLEHMLEHINKTHKVDYVIWTGDIPPHDIWNNSRKEASFLLQETSKLMKKYLGGVPIFPALGNHESSPVNSFPVPEVKGNDSIQWLYNELVTAWSPLFELNSADTIKLGAYYSILVNPGFRIISINMNYCNNLNWWVLLNSTDPTGELAWLVNQLQMAEIKGEKVHILGHIPPGNFDCLSVWSHNYYEIIKRYESTVTAQFFGHTHNDEYEIFYDTDDYTPSSRAFSIAYLGPSVTTFIGLNPSYRIYKMDGDYKNSSRVVLDHYSYYMNLTEANETKNPQWRFSYSARKAYNMTSLLPSDWDKLTKTFESNDNLFQEFYRYFVKLSDALNKPCDSQCKSTLLCRLRRGCSDKELC